MNHAGRSLGVIRSTAVALGLGAMLALLPSTQATEMHHTVVAADAVKWGPAPPSLPPVESGVPQPPQPSPVVPRLLRQ